jgi:hypothetical protein
LLAYPLEVHFSIEQVLERIDAHRRKGTTLTKEMFLNHLYGGMDEPELKIIDVFIWGWDAPGIC